MPSFFYLKQENASFNTGMYNALKYAAYLVLDQRDLCINASLKDLAHASWILNLT